MGIGDNLRRIRISKNLTQRSVAEPRYSDAYVSTVETGKRQPSPQALEHFAARLEVTVEQLKTGADPALSARLRLRLQEARVVLSSGRNAEATRLYGGIAREARRATLDRLEAKALWGLAMLKERQGDFEGAIERYEQVQRVLTGHPPTAWVEAVVGKARCLLAAGDVRFSIHILEDFLDQLQREDLGEPDAVMRLHATLAAAYFEAALYAKAHSSATEALRLSPSVQDPEVLANMNLNVARIFLQKGQIQEAHDSLLRAEDLYRQLELPDQLAKSHFARGFVFSRQGKLKEAEEELELARMMLGEVHSPIEAARVVTELARVTRLQGKASSAIVLLEDAMSVLGDNDPAQLGQALREMAICYAAEDGLKAEKLLRRSIELFEQSDEFAELAASYRALGDVLRDGADLEGACEAYRTGILVVEQQL